MTSPGRLTLHLTVMSVIWQYSNRSEEMDSLGGISHVFMYGQIKREISVMKLVRHPNVVCLHEVRCSICSSRLNKQIGYIVRIETKY